MKVFLYILLSVGVLFGQTNFDSVYKSMESKPDTIKIKLLNDLCWKERSNSPFFSVSCGEKALELGEKTGNKTLQARTLNLLGVVHRGLGNADKSIFYLKKALDISESINHQVEIAYAHNNLGGAYRLKAYYPLALQHVSRGFKIFENLGDKKGMAYCLINIGFVYNGLKNYKKAEEYFWQTYNIRKSIADTLGEAIALGEIARSMFVQNKLEEAYQTYTELEKKFQLLNDKNGQIQCWWGFGSINLQKKDFNRAQTYYQKAYDLAAGIGSVYWQIQSGNSLGIIYANLGHFDKAEDVLNVSLGLAKKFSDYNLISDCYASFAEMYDKKGEYKNSLKYLRLYSELKDSITTRENISSVSEMEALFQNEKVKRELTILQKNVEIADSQKKYFIIIIILFVAVTAVTYWRFRTERKARQVQENLRSAEAKYQLLFENAFLGIFHCLPDGAFQRVNPAMARLLGYNSPEEFIVLVPDIFALLKGRTDRFNAVIDEVLKTNTWVFTEARFARKDGTFITVNLTIRKELDKNGAISYVEVIFEDITERKKAEEKKEEYTQKLTTLNAAKDRFFSIISHDLRGPFHGFLGMTRLLAEQPEEFSKDKLKRMGDELYKSVQSQYRLLNNLLDWSKIQREEFQVNLKPLNLLNEVNAVIEPLELTARQKSIELNVTIEKDIIVSADVDLIHLLIRNLISNSIKFTNAGGHISVSAERKKNHIAISVSDDGIGIPKEDVEKLFRLDVRYTTKGTNNEAGTGLGLTLCKEIAEKHGGFIKVESEPGKGSSFIYYLPVKN